MLFYFLQPLRDVTQPWEAVRQPWGLPQGLCNPGVDFPSGVLLCNPGVYPTVDYLSSGTLLYSPGVYPTVDYLTSGCLSCIPRVLHDTPGVNLFFSPGVDFPSGVLLCNPGVYPTVDYLTSGCLYYTPGGCPATPGLIFLPESCFATLGFTPRSIILLPAVCTTPRGAVLQPRG